MKNIFQIWYETNIGPTFSTREKAVNHLDKQSGIKEEVEKNLNDYPNIRQLVLDKENVMFDR